MVKIYYGLSGSFKSSTIVKENKRILKSSNKIWKYYQNGAFKGLTEYNDLNYGILQLVRLNEMAMKYDDFAVERGVTDNIFYYLAKGNTLNQDTIENICNEELKILKNFTVEKILLIQEDYDFIRDVVLKDKYRSDAFNGDLEYYKAQQIDYINFTCKHNNIDKTIRIKSAQDYIENVLGDKFINPEISNQQ